MILSPQREAFAQAVASGKSQSEAYRTAYPRSLNWKPESVHEKASALMADAKVAARVAELRAEVVERIGLTLEAHLKELADLRDEAREDGKYGSAIQAEIARGKAAGLYVEKSELTGKDGGPLAVSTPKLEIVLSKK